MKIAVVGSGVAGLSAAWMLSGRHDVVLYEKERRFGGHSDTSEVLLGDRRVAVDTGFIVYNEPNYPNLTALFARLGVATVSSDMSFGVSLDGGRYEYGSGWGSFLGQRVNLLNPAHWRLLREISRFNVEARALLSPPQDNALSLGHYLERRGFCAPFTDRYLLPMASAIWSTSMRDMLDYPAHSFARFFANHGLLQIVGHRRWRSVSGGSRSYVARLVEPLSARARPGIGALRVERVPGGVRIRDSAGQWDSFDHVVLATHADQALMLLGDASPREHQVLGAFRYSANTAVLHIDPSLMPRRRSVWSSWNYVAEGASIDAPASVTYWMNRLQNLRDVPDVFVSLNPAQPPAPELTLAQKRYDHPLFNGAALEAQLALPQLQGEGGVYFCGSYLGYGFHEDALAAGLAVAELLGAPRPWRVAEAKYPAAASVPHRLPDIGDLMPLQASLPAPIRLRGK